MDGFDTNWAPKYQKFMIFKKNLRKNDGYVIKNGKICYKKFHFFSIFTMSCTIFFKEKIRKIKRIEDEKYTSWYKFLNWFWYSVDLKNWKNGWFQKNYKKIRDDIVIKKR